MGRHKTLIERSSDDDALLLLRLADEDGGRCDPERIYRRKRSSPSRLAFERAQGYGWFDREGWLTPRGRAALREWGAR